MARKDNKTAIIKFVLGKGGFKHDGKDNGGALIELDHSSSGNK